jgi:hypothetical protein
MMGALSVEDENNLGFSSTENSEVSDDDMTTSKVIVIVPKVGPKVGPKVLPMVILPIVSRLKVLLPMIWLATLFLPLLFLLCLLSPPHWKILQLLLMVLLLQLGENHMPQLVPLPCVALLAVTVVARPPGGLLRPGTAGHCQQPCPRSLKTQTIRTRTTPMLLG